MDTVFKYRHTHPSERKPSSPWSGKPMEENLTILFKIWTWIWLCGNVHEYQSSSCGSSRKRLWHESTIREEPSLEVSGTIIQWNKKNWSVINQKSLIQNTQEIIDFKTLNSKKLRGDRQAYCAKELIRSPMPLCTSSPTQCFVWKRWEMIQTQLGRTVLNGIRRTITSRNWIFEQRFISQKTMKWI